MADATSTDTDAGQTPGDGEGQVPEGTIDNDAGDGDGDGDGKKPEPRTYDESYVRQLRREAAASRTKLTDAEKRLAEFEDRDKSEAEKAAEARTAAEARAADAELKLLRYEVAADRGLDMAAAEFLTGSTREEVESKADELSKLLGGKKNGKGSGGFDGGARTPAPEAKKPEEAHNEFLIEAMGRKRT